MAAEEKHEGGEFAKQKPVSSEKLKWPWIVAIAGYFLPGLIGICVWLYLRLVGIPGIEPKQFGSIVRGIPFYAVVFLLWDIPFLIVATVAERLPLARSKHRGLIVGAFLGTALAEVALFIDIWKNAEAVALFSSFLLPILLGFILGGTLVGGLVGLLIGWWFERKQPASG